MLIRQGKTNIKHLLIVLVLAAIAAGWILWFTAEKEAFFVIPGEKYCEVDTDCACGVKTDTKDCFFGNKDYVDITQQCPDFCTGIGGNLTVECLNNQCTQELRKIENETVNW